MLCPELAPESFSSPAPPPLEKTTRRPQPVQKFEPGRSGRAQAPQTAGATSAARLAVRDVAVSTEDTVLAGSNAALEDGGTSAESGAGAGALRSAGVADDAGGVGIAEGPFADGKIGDTPVPAASGLAADHAARVAPAERGREAAAAELCAEPDLHFAELGRAGKDGRLARDVADCGRWGKLRSGKLRWNSARGSDDASSSRTDGRRSSAALLCVSSWLLLAGGGSGAARLEADGGRDCSASCSSASRAAWIAMRSWLVPALEGRWDGRDDREPADAGRAFEACVSLPCGRDRRGTAALA